MSRNLGEATHVMIALMLSCGFVQLFTPLHAIPVKKKDSHR